MLISMPHMPVVDQRYQCLSSIVVEMFTFCGLLCIKIRKTIRVFKKTARGAEWYYNLK